MHSFDDEAPALLDLADPAVLGRFAKELNVTEAQLIAAASIVGRMPKALRYYFNSPSRRIKTSVTAADRARYDALKLTRRPKRRTTAERSDGS